MRYYVKVGLHTEEERQKLGGNRYRAELIEVAEDEERLIDLWIGDDFVQILQWVTDKFPKLIDENGNEL